VAARAEAEHVRVRLKAELLSPDGSEVQAGETAPDEGPADLAHALLARASPALRALFAG
jgi:hypothetical protein